MLRIAVIVLVLANAAYFAWTQGLLAPLGWQPADPTESHRMQEQIQPQAIRLLNAPRQEAASAAPTAQPGPTASVAPPTGPDATAGAGVSTGAASPEPGQPPAATACWRASGFTPEQADVLRRALRALPDLQDRWQLQQTQAGGRWIVYMGKLSEEMMARKKAELRELKVDFREVRVAALSPGLALGTFSSEAAAQQGLADVNRKGVRTAKVEQERPETTVFVLDLPAITEAQRQVVDALAAMAGKTVQPCD